MEFANVTQEQAQSRECFCDSPSVCLMLQSDIILSSLMQRSSITRIIIPTVFRIALMKDYLASPDVTFDATNVTITTLVVLHYSLMAASFTYLKPFLRAFDSNLGATTKMDTSLSTSRVTALGSMSSTIVVKPDPTSHQSTPLDAHRHDPKSPHALLSLPIKGIEKGIMDGHPDGHKQSEKSVEKQSKGKWWRHSVSLDPKAPVIVKTQTFEVHWERRNSF